MQVEAFLRGVQGGTTSSYEAGPSQARQRPATAASAEQRSNGAASASSGAARASAGTPQQREMIKQIRAARGDMYKALGVARDADEDTIRKAYRKLALKLHPDKCQAAGTDEAFKGLHSMSDVACAPPGGGGVGMHGCVPATAPRGQSSSMHAPSCNT